MRHPVLLSALVLSAAWSLPLHAEDQAKADQPKPRQKSRVEQIDYGGFFAGSFVCAPDAKYDNDTGIYTADSVAKGIVVMFDKDMTDGAIFDLDSQRIACAWTGEAPQLVGWWLNGQHGPTSRLTRPAMFINTGVGWAAPDGSFADPRPDLINPLPRPGALPKEWSRTKGYYRHGRETVFSYTVGTTAVLEELSQEKSGEAKAIARSFTIAAHDKPLTVVLADATGDAAEADGVVTAGDPRATLVAAPAGAKLDVVEKRLVLRLPAGAAANVKVVVTGKDIAPVTLAALAKQAAQPADLTPKTKGGPSVWPQVLETKGILGKDDSAYTVDAIGLPETNPWSAWVRPSALDFFADGKSAALATLNGDIFVVSGIDDKLESVKWRRFAAGLHAPLGIKIVDGVIHVAVRDGIMRLYDLDKDGEADFFEMVTMDLLQSPSFHSFVCDLNTDPAGNFIFSMGGAIRAGGRGFQRLTPHMGTVLRLSKDGSKIDVVATGLRMPNGSAVRADGQITESDNEGVWVPASPIHWVKDGDFLGVKNTGHGREVHPPRPITFMPQSTDSSACSQQWVTSDRWGPFKDELLHMSYGKAGLYHVFHEEVDGVQQGGIVRFPVKLSSSALRGRFNPADGQLYVAGLGMGQTTAAKPGGFDRVRFTGKPVHLPRSFSIKADGVRVDFTTKLDAAAADPANFAVHQWNYRWTENYGSGWYSVADPNKTTNTGDEVAVKSVKLAADGMSVFLEIDGLKPVMQFAVKCKVPAADGEAIDSELMGTINVVPATKGP
ncbi:MAG TPA: DUF6797 domain-containing protein [Planctomycetota bacterium]|nr:DUF6797 domain-containing protein [Planctomycetota bacterium]